MPNKEVSIGQLLDEEDATKIFHRVREKRFEGFNKWCVENIVEPKRAHIESVIGDFDASYVAYMIEHASLQAAVQVHEARNAGRNDQTPEEKPECAYWWPRKKKTNAGSSGTVQ